MRVVHKEGWAPKNWCFWTVVLEKTLENVLDSKESKSINPKGNQLLIFTGSLRLKMKLQSFDHLMWRDDCLEKTLMLGKIEGRRRRWQQRMTWLLGITNSMDMSLSKLWELEDSGSLACCSSWSQRVRQDWVTERQTTLNCATERDLFSPIPPNK